MKRRISILGIGLILLSLVACAEPFEGESCQREVIERQHEETKSPILTFAGQKVQLPEMRVYAFQVKKEFEKIGGQDVWEFEDFSGGRKAEEAAKKVLLENILRIKILNKKADELSITLTEEEEQMINLKALDYYRNIMPVDYRQAYQIDEQLIEKVFGEGFIAEKVRQVSTADLQVNQQMIEEILKDNLDYQLFQNYTAEAMLTGYQGVEFRQIITDVQREQDFRDSLNELAEAYQAGRSLKEVMALAEQQGCSIERKKYDLPSFFDIYGNEEVHSFKVPVEGMMTPVRRANDSYRLFVVERLDKPKEEKIVTYRQQMPAKREAYKRQALEKIANQKFTIIYNDWLKEADFQLDHEQWQTISFTD